MRVAGPALGDKRLGVFEKCGRVVHDRVGGGDSNLQAKLTVYYITSTVLSCSR
jgi:hypothetical protein